MGEVKITQSKSFKPTESETTQKPAVLLAKNKINSHRISYIQIILPRDQIVHDVALKKVTFFSTLIYKITKKFKGGHGVIKLNAKDPTTGKTSEYYVKFSDILNSCGLNPKELNNLKAGELEQKISRGNNEAVAKKIEEFAKNNGLNLNDEMIKAHLARIYRAGEVGSVFRNLNLNTRKSELFESIINRVLSPPALLRIKDEYKLSKKEFSKIKHLASVVPADNLEKLLSDYSSKETRKKMFNTLFKAADALHYDGLREDFYAKKTANSYSFALGRDGQFFISFDYLDKGAFKKVNSAINVSKLEEAVKMVTRGTEQDIEEVKKEVLLQDKLYNSNNPYLLPPSKLRVLTKTKDIDETTNLPKEKYVYFTKKMDGNANSIKSSEIAQIAQICYDAANGLDYLHKNQYVHNDVKPQNILIQEKRGVMTDLGLTQGINTPSMSGSPTFIAPEHITKTPEGNWISLRTPLKPSSDSFSLGVSVLYMLFKSPPLKHRGQLNLLKGDEREKFFAGLRRETNQNFDQFSDPIKNVKHKLIDLAENLTSWDPTKRMTCAQFADELTKIPGMQINTTNPLLI